MKLSMILARSEDDVIGLNGDLPWKCPADLANFKRITQGKAVAMGRNTWNSLPRKPLPERQNIVICSNPQLIDVPEAKSDAPASDVKVAVWCPTIEAAIEWAKDQGHAELVFIGGKQIYEAVKDIVDEVHLTVMNCLISADEKDIVVKFDHEFEFFHFASADLPDWDLVETWPCFEGGTGHELFTYYHLERRKDVKYIQL